MEKIYNIKPQTLESFLESTAEIHTLYYYDKVAKCHKMLTTTTRDDYEKIMQAYHFGKLVNVANLVEANGNELVGSHTKMQARYTLKG